MKDGSKLPTGTFKPPGTFNPQREPGWSPGTIFAATVCGCVCALLVMGVVKVGFILFT